MARMISIVLLIGFCAGNASAAGPTRVGDSLVFEAEDWTAPREAWLADRDSEDHWNLWSKNASAGWSGGVVLRSPTVREDRPSPQAGAPPLHTRLTTIPAGVYEIVLNRTGRRLAVSLDGTHWRPTENNAEDSLGVFRIEDGTFDVWIDDRYATPSNVGPGYYDFIRLDPFKTPKLSHFTAFTVSPSSAGGCSGVYYQVAWISDRPVPRGTLELERMGGFESAALTSDDPSKLRNHREFVCLPADLMRVKARVRIPFAKGFEWKSEPVEIALPRRTSDKPRNQPVDIALFPPGPIVSERPMVAGVPFAPGTMWTTDGLAVTDQNAGLPTQTTVSSRWPDGSVRWLLTRFLPRPASRDLRFNAINGPAAPDLQVGRDGASVSNSVLQWGWRGGKGGLDTFALFDLVSRHGESSLTGEPQMGNVRVIDGNGKAWGLGKPGMCFWEENGPVRAVLRVEGPFQAADGAQRFRYRLRYFFTAGSPLLQVQLTLIQDAEGPEFQRIRSLAFRVPIAGDEPLRGQLAGGEAVEVRATGGSSASAGTGGQAASGTKQEGGQYEIWQLDDKNVRVISHGESSIRQERSAGWAVVQRGDKEIALAIRDFWQAWPKSIALKPDGLHVRLLPDLINDKYEARDLTDWTRHGYAFDGDGCYLLRRGMALRCEFWVRFGRAGDIERQGGPAAWAAGVLSPQYAAASPEQHCSSGAFGPAQSAARDARPEYEAMVERTVRGMLGEREKDGEYGWMNFGDWHGERGYNWGNNEYDLAWAMALQFARTGRWDYFQVGHDMARHYATVDTIHSASDPHQPGRVWPHCAGHVGVGDRRPPPGPIADALDAWLAAGDYNRHFYRGMVDPGGHIYQEGNFAYYFLTGDRDLLEAAEMVCSAQAAYFTPKFDFGIERGAGWPLSNAVAAYESTGNPFYLNAARLYIERILQKHDPVGGGWLLPQPASECDGKPGVGGKAFATGILLYGMMRYDLVEPRPDVKDCIVQACRWLVEQAWNEEKEGFRYKTGCDKYRDDANRSTTVAVCLPGLAYGYKLSGDERFIDVAQRSLANLCASNHNFGKATGMVCRQSAFALPGLAPATAE